MIASTHTASQVVILGWAWLIPIALAAASYFANKKKKTGTVEGLTPEMQKLLEQNLQSQGRRTAASEPLYNSTMSGIEQLLPNFARQAGATATAAGNQPALPNLPTPGGLSRPRVPTNPRQTKY